MLHTKQLKPGDHVRLLSFGETPLAYRRKLIAYGLTQGCVLDILRIAPLGCPIQVAVRGTSLALRKQDAAQLLWEKA